MPYIIVGLGNPGEEYEGTRHNTGRIFLDAFLEQFEFPEWKSDKKLGALISKNKIGKESVTLLEPEGFMNNSGKSLKPLALSPKQIEKLVVIYDDLDLALGTFKISFNRGSGGHRGIESLIKALKTRAFIRVRVGISPSTPKGKVKKLKGEEAVVKFILGKFKKDELDELKKLKKKICPAMEQIVLEGREKAMGEWN